MSPKRGAKAAPAGAAAPKKAKGAAPGDAAAGGRRLRGAGPISDAEYRAALELGNTTKITKGTSKAKGETEAAAWEKLQHDNEGEEIVRARIAWTGKPSELETFKLLADTVITDVRKLKRKENARVTGPKKRRLEAILDGIEVPLVPSYADTGTQSKDSDIERPAKAPDFIRADQIGTARDVAPLPPAQSHIGERRSAGNQADQSALRPLPEEATTPGNTTPNQKSTQVNLSALSPATPQKLLSLTGYEMVRCIGAGSYAVCYLYSSRDRGDIVIKRIKIPRKQVARDLERSNVGYVRGYMKYVEIRAYREMKWLYRFDHPNIIKCLGHIFEEGTLMYLMPAATTDFWSLFRDSKSPLCESPRRDLGWTAQAKREQAEALAVNRPFTPWKKAVRRRWRLRSAALWRAWIEMLSACEYIHSQGVVHLDIKPNNILVDKWTTGDDANKDPDEWARNLRFYLADFGVSQKTGSFLYTEGGVGASLYAAPENQTPPYGYGAHGHAHESVDCYVLYKVFWLCFVRPTSRLALASRVKETELDCEPTRPFKKMATKDPAERMSMTQALEVVKNNDGNLRDTWINFVPDFALERRFKPGDQWNGPESDSPDDPLMYDEHVIPNLDPNATVTQAPDANLGDGPPIQSEENDSANDVGEDWT